MTGLVYDLEFLAEELSEQYGTSLEMLTVSERIPQHIWDSISEGEADSLCKYIWERAQEISRGE